MLALSMKPEAVKAVSGFFYAGFYLFAANK